MGGTTMDLLGVNLAGAEFGSVGQPYGQGYTYPTHAEIDYEAAKGMNVIRLPFLWERLQPTLNGALDPAELARLDDVVNYAASKGLTVDLDVHDFGNYNGQAVGSSAVPNSAFADLWGKLASHYATSPNVIFGLMNEPQQSSAAGWLQSVNAAIAAIRSAGAQQEVLVPGIGYDGAWTWTTDGNSSVIGTGVVDPAKNFAFEVHQYLDSDGSGTHADVVSADIGVERLQAITQWAESTGNRLFLGEFGVSSDATSLNAMSNMLSYMDQHTDAWQGGTYWAAGPWWGNYMYSAEPSNGVDAPQMTVLEGYKHVPAGSSPSTSGATAGTDPAASGAAPSQSTSVASGSSAAGTENVPAASAPAASAPVATANAVEPTVSANSSPSTSAAAAGADPTGSSTTSSPQPTTVTSATTVTSGSTTSTGDIPAGSAPAAAANTVDSAVPAATANAASSAGAAAGPSIAVDPVVTFTGPRTVILSGTASAASGVTAVHLFEGGTDLGAADVAPDGSWTLSLTLRPGFHTGLSAVATDAAGDTSSTATNFDLTTVGNRPSAKASIDNYDTSGAYLGTTQFNADGSVYLQWTVASLPHGATQERYTSGTSLAHQGLSSKVDTYNASDRLVSEVQAVAVGGAHRLAATAAPDTFVFQHAFGRDLVAGFTASGPQHDVLSLPTTEFGSVAAILTSAIQNGADTVISAHNGDTITLSGVAKSDLAGSDFKLHA